MVCEYPLGKSHCPQVTVYGRKGKNCDVCQWYTPPLKRKTIPKVLKGQEKLL